MGSKAQKKGKKTTTITCDLAFVLDASLASDTW